MTPEMLVDLQALAPEVWLTGALLAALVLDLLFGRRGHTAVGLVALAGTVGALACLAGNPAGEPSRAFGLLSMDGFGAFFRVLVISGTGLVVLHAMVFRSLDAPDRNEFYPVLLGAALGGCLLVSADHLLMLLLAMEMLSLPSYLLAGWQKGERRSSEAALKYLVYGALASALMVFGFSLIWGVTGSLWLPEVGVGLAEQWELGGLAGRSVVVGATVLVLAGFLFKVAAFPFHFWAPDVYEGSPTPVTTMLAVASKAAGFGLLVRFVDAVFLGMIVPADWLARLCSVLAVLAAITMTYGNITAVLQRNVKRLLAYSSIAHAGYLLMGLAVMTSSPDGVNAVLGREALLFYLVTYYLGTLGAFGCVMALANRFGAEDLEDYEGLGWSAPWMGILLTLFLVSLTGLPPTVGFVGKWMLFYATLDSGLGWLALVAALNAVVALFYYFRVVRNLFLRGDRKAVAGLRATGPMPALAHLSLFGLGLAVVWLCLDFDGLMAWVGAAAL